MAGRTIAALAAAVLWSASAQAAYVIDTGPGSEDVVAQKAAIGPQTSSFGRFTLREAVRIDSIEFFGLVATSGRAAFSISTPSQLDRGNPFGTTLLSISQQFTASTVAGWHAVSGVAGDPLVELGPGTYWVGLGSAGDTFTAAHYGGAARPLDVEKIMPVIGGFIDSNARLAWRIGGSTLLDPMPGGGGGGGGVPEPATWALMILGFGAVGGALRRGRATKRVACGLT